MSTFLRPLINPQIVVGSTRLQPVGRINQAAARRQEQPGSSPFSGSTRQQTFGRINQVADCGDGDEGEDEDKGEEGEEALLGHLNFFFVINSMPGLLIKYNTDLKQKRCLNP